MQALFVIIFRLCLAIGIFIIYKIYRDNNFHADVKFKMFRKGDNRMGDLLFIIVEVIIIFFPFK